LSYTVLAVKWRPRRFETLVGQADVVKALVNSLGAGRLHHAYLFSGTRGVGKTTVARILAKALNCESGVGAEPCGECSACVAIDEGRFVDLIEVDAASRTRVDDTRELLDNVQYMPSRGRYKVYLIDEVHMLSTHSFNALLKTLEEPPPHVKFLLATTDPQKLPVTVLSRCLQFHLKKLSTTQIHDQLAQIASAEGIAAESDGLRSIALAADGSMRDALSLLDQAIAFGGGAIRTSEVRQMLGSIDRDRIVGLLEALAGGDGAALIDAVDSLDELGVDFGTVLDELMGALQRIAVVQLVKTRASDSDDTWVGLAEALGPEDVQLYFQIALGGRRDIAICRDERMSFEMTMLRMLAFRPLGSAGTRSAERSDRPAARGTPRPPRARAATEPEAGVVAKHTQGAAASEAAPERRPAKVPQTTGTIADWPSLVRAAQLRGAVRNLADHCELATMQGNRIELVLHRDKANFNTEQLRQRLEESLARHLDRDVTIRISVGDPPRATPAEVRRASEDSLMRETREAIEQDPNIRAVQAAFDAVLEPDSILPTPARKAEQENGRR
jgi:DNA polymerase-3 subunit gamma/tau